MAWDYWTWVECSVGISVGIAAITLVVLLILLSENDAVFYGIVAQLLNIERCFIDVHHNIVRRDDKANLSTDMFTNLLSQQSLLSNLPVEMLSGKNEVFDTIRDSALKNLPVNQTPDNLTSQISDNLRSQIQNNLKSHIPDNLKSQIPNNLTSQIPNNLKNLIPDNLKNQISDNLNTANGLLKNAFENDNNAERKNPEETKQIPLHSRSHPEHERQVLNVYGKYIALHKKGTLFFVIILTTIIISGALLAAFNSLFLATTTVYRNGLCPALGAMDCYCGDNHTYFSCTTGQSAAFPFDASSAACFRWIATDLTTSDITTQLGVTAGLLVAFGSIAEAIIRIYLLAFNKRLSIATGIHRIAAKTIGINKSTARTRCLCCNLCWHCSACNLSLFKHPAAVIIVTGIYIAIPILMFPAVILLYYYKISVTALTFVILIVFAVLCILAIVWIMVQESEASSNMPGGWSDAEELFKKAVTKSVNIGTGKGATSKE